MSSDSNKKQKNNLNEEIHMPDYAEVWKEMYFKNEAAWGEAFKELISTQSFVGFINNTLEQNLSNEKVTRQIIDKYMEMAPVPSKKDISRVAELVISLEEKIDEIEFKLNHTTVSMTDSLLKMVDYQAEIKEEMTGLRHDLSQIEMKLGALDKKITALTKEPRETKKKSAVPKSEEPKK